MFLLIFCIDTKMQKQDREKTRNQYTLITTALQYTNKTDKELNMKPVAGQLPLYIITHGRKKTKAKNEDKKIQLNKVVL